MPIAVKNVVSCVWMRGEKSLEREKQVGVALVEEGKQFCARRRNAYL